VRFLVQTSRSMFHVRGYASSTQQRQDAKNGQSETSTVAQWAHNPKVLRSKRSSAIDIPNGSGLLTWVGKGSNYRLRDYEIRAALVCCSRARFRSVTRKVNCFLVAVLGLE